MDDNTRDKLHRWGTTYVMDAVVLTCVAVLLYW